MNAYKHSGAMGDLIYSLAIAQELGVGDFYLHLNQLDWVGRHYYGVEPAPFHQGRMTQQDFEYMESFMQAQPYINEFEVLRDQEVTHNLDRFRPLFVGHPTHYLDVYNQAFGIEGAARDRVLTTPWVHVPEPIQVKGRNVVVNRTQRWLPPELSPEWNDWREQGIDAQSLFVGLPNEFEEFKKATGWTQIEYYPTQTMLELASVLAGADMFIGNQSQCYALAVGLNLTRILLETRRDLPITRNECYFPAKTQIEYF